MTAPPPPPHPSKLPYSTVLVAGLGVATVIADMDFETYSEAGFVWSDAEQKWVALPGAAQGKKGLPVVGMAAYAMHPSTEVLTLSYNLKDGRGTRRWRPGLPLPTDLFDHVAAGKLIEAWNAGFEWWIWSEVCAKRYGWPPVPTAQFRCAQAKARASGLPASLAKAGAVLGLEVQKDKAGEALIKKFCVPRNPTKSNPSRRIRPEDDPEAFERLCVYCDTDIETEAEASSRIPDLTGEELAYWQADQAINRRGVYIDLPAVEDCIAIVEQATQRACSELQELTGGKVAGPTKVGDTLAWLDRRGLDLTALDEDTVADALKRPLLPPDVRRVLEIRRDTASAAVKKLYAMRVRTAPDTSRAHDLFNYHATRTGRCTGADIQATNLPNSGEKVKRCESCGKTYGSSVIDCPHCGCDGAFAQPAEWGPGAAADAFEAVTVRSLDYLEFTYGKGRALPVVSSMIRGQFRARPGHKLIVGDYSAIEAVGLAMLAGEQWRIDVFNTHGKIYEMSAAKVTGVPFDEILAHKERTKEHHPLRKTIGKTCELALGYRGWVGSMVAFGAEAFMTEPQMKDTILKWRDESPAIPEFWGGQFRGAPWSTDRQPCFFGVEGAAIQALLSPGRWFDVRHGVAFMSQAGTLYCRLPSGRLLTYRDAKLHNTGRWDTMQISYWGWNTNPKNGPVGWIQIWTHGGKLTENIVQAACRDLLRHATLKLEDAGYPLVLHVYDEIVVEVPEGFGSDGEFAALMADRPAWAADWPVRVGEDMFREVRYRK